ncbi:glycosyltransferase [Geobacter sp.]|uniref:glycosyltransferase n=1 Tax=Geobacter sp. TaxID=46610 RepID=UPI00262DB7FA|nr:glycosyltransferase [Geobacter sp.]
MINFAAELSHKISVVAVLTCYNRKTKTETCLASLYNAVELLAGRIHIRVFITDDGSSDGTNDMLRDRFPQVEVLRGNGGLFWNGGMRLAFGQALEGNYDFYLWLNDDTVLYPDSIECLLATHDELVATTGRSGIVVGTTRNDEGKSSYGGQRRQEGSYAPRFIRVEPTDKPQPCDTFNGNCVLISAEAAKRLGNLEAAFKHSMGDTDYGLRATKMGIPIWVMPGFVGLCTNDNVVQGTYLDRTLPLAKRWKKAMAPKGLPPHAWRVFCHRHTGPFWPLYWLWPYVKLVITSLMRGLKCTHPVSVLALSVAIAIVTFSCGLQAANQATSPRHPLRSEFFGIHIHRADTTTRWPFVRFGAWRLWDAHVNWRDIEPSKGLWRFDKMDQLLSLADKNKVEPLIVLGVTPQWASSRPNEPFVYGAGGAAEPYDIRDWENYVRKLATRYKGRIHHYELWNEPKYSDFESVKGAFYTGTLDSLVKLACSAYRVLKEVDPNNQLLTPGFTGASDRLDKFLSNGGKECSDIVAFHFYTATPEKMLERVRDVQQVMKNNGVADRELWNTEQGYEVVGPDAKIPGNLGFEVRDIETEAAYIPRAFVLAAAAGVNRFYFYSWERILEKDGTPSVAAQAMGHTVRWLKNATIESCGTENGEVWTCSLTRQGRKAWMVWNARGYSELQIPNAWEIKAFESLDGPAGLVQTPVITLGQSAILLKQEAVVWTP